MVSASGSWEASDPARTTSRAESGGDPARATGSFHIKNALVSIATAVVPAQRRGPGEGLISATKQLPTRADCSTRGLQMPTCPRPVVSRLP